MSRLQGSLQGTLRRRRKSLGRGGNSKCMGPTLEGWSILLTLLIWHWIRIRISRLNFTFKVGLTVQRLHHSQHFVTASHTPVWLVVRGKSHILAQLPRRKIFYFLLLFPYFIRTSLYYSTFLLSFYHISSSTTLPYNSSSTIFYHITLLPYSTI
jgi:hypothetical protein